MGTVKSSLINPDQYQFVEVSREYTSGDGTGLVVVYKYRGSKDALRVASLAWVNAGGKYQITENGPYSEATVTYSGTAVPVDYAFQAGAATTPAPITEQNLTDETPSFRYEFRTEYIDASLFDLAKVRAEAKKFVETFGTGATEGPSAASQAAGAAKWAGVATQAADAVTTWADKDATDQQKGRAAYNTGVTVAGTIVPPVGAAIALGNEAVRDGKSADIAFIVCDGGWKYLSTGVYGSNADEATEGLDDTLWA